MWCWVGGGGGGGGRLLSVHAYQISSTRTGTRGGGGGGCGSRHCGGGCCCHPSLLGSLRACGCGGHAPPCSNPCMAPIIDSSTRKLPTISDSMSRPPLGGGAVGQPPPPPLPPLPPKPPNNDPKRGGALPAKMESSSPVCRSTLSSGGLPGHCFKIRFIVSHRSWPVSASVWQLRCHEVEMEHASSLSSNTSGLPRTIYT